MAKKKRRNQEPANLKTGELYPPDKEREVPRPSHMPAPYTPPGAALGNPAASAANQVVGPISDLIPKDASKSKGSNKPGLPNFQVPTANMQEYLSGQILNSLAPLMQTITPAIADYGKSMQGFESMMPPGVASVFQQNVPQMQQALGGLISSTTQAASEAPQTDIFSTLLNALKNFATSQAVYYSNPAPLQGMFGHSTNPGVQALMGMLGNIGSVGAPTGSQPIAPQTNKKNSSQYPTSLPTN